MTRFLRGLLTALMLALASPTLAHAATATSGWPSWLDWLFGRRERTTTAIEITDVKLIRHDDGTMTVAQTYTVRWTSDGNGAPDSLLATATGTGQAAQAFNSGSPQFPVALAVSWTTPVPGASVTTQLCARVKRRGLYSVSNCSASRTYSSPDVPPPPPAIDTTNATFRVTFSGSTRTGPLHYDLTEGQVYPVCILGLMNGRAGAVQNDPGCVALLASEYPLTGRWTTVEQTWVDSHCFRIQGGQALGTYAGLPSCWMGARWRRDRPLVGA